MYVYFIFNSLTKNYKIGKTKNNADRRLKQLQTGNEIELKIVRCIEYENPEIEKYLHEYFQDRRLHGEWFKVSIEEIDYVIALIKNTYKHRGSPGSLKYTDPKDIKLSKRIIKGNYIRVPGISTPSSLSLKQFLIYMLILWLVLMIMRYYWRTF